MNFATDYKSILEKIENVNPIEYAKSRNYINGAVTYLSPYISRGVISLPQVKNSILKRYTINDAEKLLQELAWREYWLRVWESIGDKIFNDIKQAQFDVEHIKMIDAVKNATTEINAIDKSIDSLYQTGYMHNHCRMYVASICCNIAKAHWLSPSKWMYYYLLDGDLASNTLSWQWVAGTFSSKKYYCNQDNINKYTCGSQQNTFLDVSYDELIAMPIPAALQQFNELKLTANLPNATTIKIDENLPTLIYNTYNLDVLWHKDENANRILLLEPSHFNKFPVSKMVLDFCIDLSKNIEGIQMYVGEFNDLKKLIGNSQVYYKKHPAFLHYKGVEESLHYLFPQVGGYHNSFFNYWKKCKKYL